MSVPTADIQTLNPSAVIELFELDVTSIGGSILRFHNGTNGLGASVVWQGVTYTAFPLQASDYDMSSKGVMPRPKIQIANVTGLIGAQLRAYEDLVGAKVTRKRTLLRFLDAVNFAGGVNPSADPAASFPDDVFFIEQKTSEDLNTIEFELTASNDLQGMVLPRRIVQAKTCGWNDASICPYSVGGQCAKTPAACATKWTTGGLPFGGYPGSQTVS